MWIYQGKEISESDIGNYIGFVYRITNNINGKKYLGKKLFKFSKTKIVKGKKKKYKVDSDWKTYYGSNDELKKDVEIHGPENFTREILRLCSTKGEASYYESKLILESDAIIRDDYYNSWLSVKVSRSHLPK